jgi:hypothetical protein
MVLASIAINEREVQDRKDWHHSMNRESESSEVRIYLYISCPEEHQLS